MVQAIIQGPLNRAQIDSVTRKDTDHKQLWENTNTALANNAKSITTQSATLTTHEAQIAALQKSTSATATTQAAQIQALQRLVNSLQQQVNKLS